jgi:hypothetical protein
MSSERKNLFANVDVEGIIKNSIRSHIVKEESKLPQDDSSLNEAYVHEPKQFKQVSEFVSQKTKSAHI